jgi:hypothetical protein
VSLIQNILTKVKEESEQEGRHHSLGVYRASEIAGCARALQYATLNYPAEPFTPETLLIFKDGHTHHNAIRELLGKVGTLSHVEKTISKKYKHNGVAFTITGTVDCVWNDIVTDIKSMSTFRFKNIDKEWPDEFMGYIEQVNLYQDILGKEKGGILFKNKNDGELKFMRANLDPEILNRVLDRVAEVHKGAKKEKITIERPYPNSHFFCKTCIYRMPCRSLPMEGKHWPEGVKNPAGGDLTGKLRESIRAGRKGRRLDSRKRGR